MFLELEIHKGAAICLVGDFINGPVLAVIKTQ